MKITLPGAGTPAPKVQGFGTSRLVEAGGLRALLGRGRGATVRLSERCVPIGSIEAVILPASIRTITHLWLTPC